ncbi:MAG TPA: biopolymer transporter ExbD [Bacteroidota bacterium]|nr:biopolymer transporter ExbD [Bacteroidota bacterium]
MAEVDVKESRGKQKHSKKKRRRVGVRIDMTPMVDIAFLLLTFFMLTTTMNKPQAMEINLPPGDSKVDVPASNLLTLRVSENGTIYWNLGTEKPEKVTPAELRKVLKEKNSANPKLITLIKVDRKGKYIMMVNIMDELNVSDITRFSLAPFDDKDKQLIEKI